MKNNKKGFTLIELLAVIVILAIIALIATPIVLNIIAKARKSAAQDSLYGVMEATKTTYMSSLLEGTQITLPAVVECKDDVCTFYKEDGTTVQKDSSNKDFTVSFSGTIPTSGSLNIDNEGRITQKEAFEVNGYNCTIGSNEKVTCGS